MTSSDRNTQNAQGATNVNALNAQGAQNVQGAANVNVQGAANINAHNAQQYQEKTIVSARPEDLTLMMYNGLMKFIARAQEEIRAKSFEAAHGTLIRCQDIVFEFQFTLNMDYEVSNNLMLLYDYLYNRLIEANAKKDCDILDEVLGFVTELRDTWLEAVGKSREQKAAAAAAAMADVEAARAGDGAGSDVTGGADVAAARQPARQGTGTGADSGAGTADAPAAGTAAQKPQQSRNKAIYTRGAQIFGAAAADAARPMRAASVAAAAAPSAVTPVPATAVTPVQSDVSPVLPAAVAVKSAPVPAVPAAQPVARPAARTASSVVSAVPAAARPVVSQPASPGLTATPAPFGQAAAAARAINNPMNRINPAVAAQYAKVSKSKDAVQESISIASK